MDIIFEQMSHTNQLSCWQLRLFWKASSDSPRHHPQPSLSSPWSLQESFAENWYHSLTTGQWPATAMALASLNLCIKRQNISADVNHVHDHRVDSFNVMQNCQPSSKAPVAVNVKWKFRVNIAPLSASHSTVGSAYWEDSGMVSKCFTQLWEVVKKNGLFMVRLIVRVYPSHRQAVVIKVSCHILTYFTIL